MSRHRFGCPLGRFVGAGLVVAMVTMGGAPCALAQLPSFAVTPIPQDVGDDAGPQSFVLADVNDDGRDDLVAINRLNESTKVLIRLAEEGGTLRDPPTEVDVFIDDGEEVPLSLAVGDVGSPFVSDDEGAPDGNADIVVGTDSGLVVILVGDGEGGFSVRDEVLDVGIEIVGIALEDFNDDTDLDIAALDDSDAVIMLLNEGTAFDPDEAEEFETNGDLGIDIAAGQFDDDEQLDVAVLNQDSVTISLLLGDGDGGFPEEAVEVSVFAAGGIDPEQFPTDFAIGDLEEDGIDNAVVIEFGDVADQQALVASGVRFGDRTGVPAPFQGTGVVLANFNGDSQDILDAVFLSETEGAVFQVGDGSPSGFPDGGGTTLPRVPSGRAIATGDVNGDDRPDFIVLNNAGTEFSLAINGGAIVTVTPGTPGTATPPTAGVTGTPTATRATNTPPPTPTPTRIPTVPLSSCSVQLRRQSDQGVVNALQRPVALTAGDIDGNATQDVVVADREQGKVFALLLDPSRFDRRSEGCQIPADPSPAALPGVTPTPAAFYVELEVAQPRDVALGQLSRPEELTTDLAVVGSAGLSLFFGDGNGGFGQRLNFTTLGSDARAVVITDLDLDGIRDVVVARHDARELVVFKGGGNRTFSEVLRLDTIDDPIALVAEHFDTDEFPDLAFAGDGVSSVRLYLSPGRLIGLPPPPTPTPAPTPEVSVIVAGVPTDLASEDFNRDGATDLVATLANGAFVTLTTTRGNGTVTLNPSTLQNTGGLPMAVGAGRFDDNLQDLEPDVVVADFVNDDALFFYRGGGSFTAQSPVQVGGRPVALAVADFDSDRRVDVLVASETNGTLTLLRSAVAPSTPTPTNTFTITPTPTFTNTRPTGTPTASPSITASGSPSRTPTMTPQNTPKDGTFQLSEGSCAVVPAGGSGGWTWLIVSTALALVCRRGRRAAR